jgi:hypothetical protein
LQQPIYQNASYSLWSDHVAEGRYTARAISSTEIESNYPIDESRSEEMRRWKLHENLGKYPHLKSDNLLQDALYNLSLEELALDTREDNAFIAGAKWQGIWTRDVSYSILLSLAAIDPEAAKATLLHKVNRERGRPVIIQDTGTGGSWPVSSDRVTWLLAAWEIYLTTGDRAWLRESYEIIRNMLQDDRQVVFNEGSLARGESSFLDWREQTYPRWMEPADIYSSEALGTNAVFYRSFAIAEAMAKELGEPAEPWAESRARLSRAFPKFWQEDRGYYGQYLYGRAYQSLSPRFEALGEYLAILFDIAEPAQQDRILSSQPLMDYGVPTVYPETPNIPPYHNRSVWPFVQAFGNLAAAKRENGSALVHGLASTYRQAALFLTNKENFVVETGSPIGIEINSDRQLWSVAGNLAMTLRIFFGMHFELNGLHLKPVIPASFDGSRKLTNFRYRNAVLSIEVKGHGSRIDKFLLDGKITVPIIPTTLSGSHAVLIQMDGKELPAPPLNMVKSVAAPDTPVVRREADSLQWAGIPGAQSYQVYRNGKRFKSTQKTDFAYEASDQFVEYQVSAIDAAKTESFLSEPVQIGEALHFKAGDSEYVTLDIVQQPTLSIRGQVPVQGSYRLTFRYANGSGPINTDNKCATRTLFVDGKRIGPIVLPQRGQNDWTNWGVSSAQMVQLTGGEHRFELRLEPSNQNMNGSTNTARIASMFATRLE